ncbi:hypothetical protein MHPYR_100139 [uncultured Mycobacterium sp.]|uniref:Uncharacterized protein n=1 Tax=uncultured Mycobacterium sp. TaxID=171292 RepID=A0A1Y5P1J6_9MYCO|nr:hypothetical protein MHPYR_100139 [uncultured Mycobacterium sp.]
MPPNFDWGAQAFSVQFPFNGLQMAGYY